MKRLFHSRKGRADEGGDSISPFLVAAAIGVVVLLLGVLLYQKVYLATRESPEEARCRASIVAHSKILYASAGDFATKIECSPKMITINTNDEEKAKRQLAEAMKSCWDRWQRGKLELFKEEGIYCNPCAVLKFEGKAASLNNFASYLATTPIKKDGPTYADYLTASESIEAKGNVPETGSWSDEGGDVISTAQDQAVLFLYARGDSTQRIKDSFGKNPVRNVKKLSVATGIGAGVGGAIGVGVAVFLIGTGGTGAVVIGIGAAVLGAATGGIGGWFLGSSDKPEWVAVVVLRPNDAAAIGKLGCQMTNQQGPASTGPKDV